MRSNRKQIESRVLDELHYVIDFNATVRATAKASGVSKSTVHKDIVERSSQLLDEGIEGFTEELIIDAQNVLAKNKAERHIRGGRATQLKYLKQSQRERSKSTLQSPVFIPSAIYET